VAAIATKLGTPLMPWQRHVVDVALEIDPATGLLAYRTVVVTVPRQAGKTTLLLSVMTHRALGPFGGNQRIVYTAQTAQDARHKWRDEHVPMLEQSEFEPMFEVRHSNGSEAVRWGNGSLQTIVATTEKAGHGQSLDLAVVDEAFAHDNRLEQSLKPAMITREQPQLWIISTAGTASSTWLRSKVDRGRESCSTGEASGMAYFEWSAGDDDDPTADATWLACHPALGHTISLEALRADFASMELAEAERAYLNRWTSAAVASPIPVSTWNRREDTALELGDDLVFALDFTPDRSSASIVAAGPAGDRNGVELVDHRKGTDWVVSRCIELHDRWKPRALVVDGAGPAASVIPDLEAAGIPVVVSGSRDMASACGRIYDAVINDKLRHRGQPPLTAAVTGSAKRKLGDAWAWSRSSSAVDISPLVAATLALWGATSIPAKPAADPVLAVW
jgi:phage terminase large subunit-like protein